MANNLTVYQYDDTGATWPPASVVSESSGYLSRYLALYEVLKACLVEGYLGKAAAGWTMLHDEIAAGTGLRYAITNASQTGVLKVESGGGYHSPIITVCEGAPTLDDLINDWSSLNTTTHGQSGNSWHHFQTHYSDTYWQAGHSNAIDFTVVATENSAVIHFVQGTLRQDETVGTNYFWTFYVGAAFYDESLHDASGPLLGNFVCRGGYVNASKNYRTTTCQFGKVSATQEPSSHMRDGTGAIITARGGASGALFPGITANILNYATPQYRMPLMCLVPGICLDAPSTSKMYYANFAYRLPIYCNSFAGGSKTMKILLAAAYGVGFYQAFSLAGVEYMVFNQGYSSTQLLPVIPLDASLWP